MCILGSVLHMLLLSVVKNVECDAVDRKANFRPVFRDKKKKKCFLLCFRFSELNFYQASLYEKEAIKSSCFNFFVSFHASGSLLLRGVFSAANMLVAYL